MRNNLLLGLLIFIFNIPVFGQEDVNKEKFEDLKRIYNDIKFWKEHIETNKQDKAEFIEKSKSYSEDEVKSKLEYYDGQHRSAEEKIKEGYQKAKEVNYILPSDAKKDPFSTKGKKIKELKVVTNTNETTLKYGTFFNFGVIAITEDGQEIKTSNIGGKNDLDYNFELVFNNNVVSNDGGENYKLVDAQFLYGHAVEVKVYDRMNPENSVVVLFPIEFGNQECNFLKKYPLTFSIVGMKKKNVYLVKRIFDRQLNKPFFHILVKTHYDKYELYIVEPGKQLTVNIESDSYSLEYDIINVVVVNAKFNWTKVLNLNIIDKRPNDQRYISCRLDPKLNIDEGTYNGNVDNFFKNYADFE